MEVEDFMNYLFIPTLDKVVYASTLFMLTCGHLVAFEESYMTMKQAIKCLRPKYTIMFTAPDFISAVVKAFVMTYSIQVLIQGHDLLTIFQDLLNTSIDLHMHTDPPRLHLARGPVHSMAPYLLQSLGTDIRGTTVIAIHGARLCPWDARSVALFIRGPDRNLHKKVHVQRLRRWPLWSMRKKLCMQRHGCPFVWDAASSKSYEIIGDRGLLHAHTTEGLLPTPIDIVKLLVAYRLARKPGVQVLSAASIFRENEVSNPTDPRTIPRNMLLCTNSFNCPRIPMVFTTGFHVHGLVRGNTLSHASHNADAPPPTWLQRVPGHPTTTFVSIWQLVPLFTALAFHEMDNYADHAAILCWTTAFEPRLFYWGLTLIPRGYYIDDDGGFVVY
ncbi:hypothetical protein BKA83DRAFT_4124461 [Pisolithus microcarpus]|nr:hypothetical protein BKA83DRAFT_4124461 [Pisolithus microcarpus]